MQHIQRCHLERSRVRLLHMALLMAVDLGTQAVNLPLQLRHEAVMRGHKVLHQIVEA